MDRRERLPGDDPAAILAALQGFQSSIWTAMPGIIQDYNATANTTTIQVAVKCQVQQQDGTFVWTAPPPLLDCPVVWPRGGGALLTFPVQKGDECLVVFASRCIDMWWQSSQISQQAEMRMHDLSDGFCLPGPYSRPKAAGVGISSSKVELRTEDGAAKVSIDPTTKNVAVTANRIDLNGSLFINGAAYTAHRHSGIQSGSGTSGGVV